jgi:hypothetical protein
MGGLGAPVITISLPGGLTLMVTAPNGANGGRLRLSGGNVEIAGDVAISGSLTVSGTLTTPH